MRVKENKNGLAVSLLISLYLHLIPHRLSKSRELYSVFQESLYSNIWCCSTI